MNLMTITGCIVNEPTEKPTSGGHTLKTFSIGNSIGRGEKKEDMYWNVLLWGTRFDKITSWLKKGRMITVVGSLSSKPACYRKGEECKVDNLKITAEIIFMLPESKKKEDENLNHNSSEVPF